MTHSACKAQSKTLAIIHETMTGLYKAGVIGRRTMREFDVGCLGPVELPTCDDGKPAKRRRLQKII